MVIPQRPDFTTYDIANNLMKERYPVPQTQKLYCQFAHCHSWFV
jgi:hypothetical protein